MRDFTLDDIKRLIDDPFTLDPIGYAFLDSRFQEPQNKTHLYYRLFYYLARYLQPSFTVELGGWQGTAAAHFAKGWELGTVVTIDHHTDPGDEMNKVKMLEAEGECNNLRYIQGWTNDILAQREKGNHAFGDAPSAIPSVLKLGKSNGIEGIDILFVDSWHQYEEAKMDWQAYQPLLSSPSLVICDDIIGGYGAGIGGMLDFWNELPGKKFLNDTMHPSYPMGFLKYE
jgi:hypothetical protein